MADAPVIGVAAITGGDVEHAVRAETDPVAIVIELRPVDRRDDPLAVDDRLVRIVGRNGELGHGVGVRPPETLAEIALRVQMTAIGDIELAIVGEVRMERHAEQGRARRNPGSDRRYGCEYR